ncbi:MAG: heavy metal translocating P-type ATPase metal-binding domain-containing protein [Saprospiraceae bacterium]|nr:heavy metal translocating P-type ATPase metal-binding domain-containing protein [Saprospiraceae bacterium]
MVAIPENGLTQTANACYHCGDDCGAHPVLAEEKKFCCTGCHMVYEILAENDLCQFYQIEDRPGMSLKGRREERYAYLDDSEIVERLVDFRDETRTRVTLFLPQIHCASCIWLLENLYRLDAGVLESKVNFLKKEIYLTFANHSTSLRKMVEVLASIGYPPEINLGDADAKDRKPVDRSFYYRLGVAGFAFGNIMLLSFPEYLGLEQATAVGWERVFSFLSIAIALPVVFYSGNVYLQSAWQGLRQRHLNIDLPISIGILTLFIRSVFEILLLNGAGYLDSMAGLVFFLLIGRWFQQKTYYRLSFERDYKSYFPIAASRFKDGVFDSVALDKLAVGDLVLVRNGELIPADGLLHKGEGRIDYSFVTGEDDPIRVSGGERVYAGGRQVGEAVELTLVKTPSQSYLTRLWNDEAFQTADKPAVSRLADGAGRFFTYAILLIATATFLYWFPKDMSIAINAATAVLIIACPCAVALSIPFTLGNALRILARKGFFLKNTSVIEQMREVDTVVFDKTGTITQNANSAVHYQGVPLDEAQRDQIRSLTRQSNHPASQAIYKYLGAGPGFSVSAFREFPGAGIEGMVQGAKIRLGKAGFVPGTQTGSLLEVNGEVLGSFEVQPGLRPGFSELVTRWKQDRALYLLSGDGDRDRQLLSAYLPAEHLFFRQSPANKLDFIRGKQKEGKKVLMLGDGLNDAGALKQADVGIVVAENTNNFTPACDAILNADDFRQLPDMLAFARKSVSVVHASFVLAFVYNIVGLSFAVQGTLAPVVAAILMPLSSITVVVFGVALSSLFARKMLGR